LSVEQEAVEGLLELFDGGGVELEQEAVFTGDAVALGDLRQRLGKFGDVGELSGGGADAGERGDGQSERGGVDLELVAGDDPGSFQALDPFGDRRCAHADPSGQRGHADARVGVQLGQQADVDLVE